MASRKRYELLKKANEEATDDAASKQGLSSETQVEDHGFYRRLVGSVPEGLKSTVESSSSDGGLKNISTHSCPQISTQVTTSFSGDPPSGSVGSGDPPSGSVSSDDPPSDQQNRNETNTNCCVSCCISCYACCICCCAYNNRFSNFVKNSCWIYFFQAFVLSMCIASIVMAIQHHSSCNGKFVPGLSGSMAGVALIIFCLWFAKVRGLRRSHIALRTDPEKILAWIGVFYIFLIIYVIFFNSTTCEDPYFTFLWVQNGSILVCSAAAASIYLKDCCNFLEDTGPEEFNHNGDCPNEREESV